MDDDNKRKLKNVVLDETTMWLHDELKRRIEEADGDNDAIKNSILEMLVEYTGISEEDWNLLLQSNLYAMKIERGMGVTFEASVNACMYTNFLLGYFMAKNLQVDIDTIPEEWT
jgi:hypothetical protein